jgi:hydrogenase expression/formation protein HypC
MCLAIPSRIVSTDGFTAIVDVCGARREANLMLLPEEVAPGDFVLVHAGLAMQTVDRHTAEESLTFFSRLVAAAALPGERQRSRISANCSPAARSAGANSLRSPSS